MTPDDLDALHQLNETASAAPWHVLFANDDMCMSAVLVTRNPDVGRIVSRDQEWEPDDVVAACLLQSHDVASSSDRCWDENARLIAGVRNALPELLRLAALGLKSETQSHGST